MKLNHVNLRRKYRIETRLPTRHCPEEAFTTSYVLWLESIVIKNQKLITFKKSKK